VASELSRIPAHSIRQYIDRGLLLPFKLDSRRHLFSPSDVFRLKQIHELIHVRGLNFAGIRTMMAAVPCWALKNCPPGDRKNCQAYLEDSVPCWESSGKGRTCRNQNCRECKAYYRMPGRGNLKALLRELL
jgi:hypothetical protein